MEKGVHYIVLVSMVRALCMLKKRPYFVQTFKVLEVNPLDCCRLDL